MSSCSTPVVILKNSVSPSGERTLARVSPCGDAIGLQNLKHLSPVDSFKGFSEVDEYNYCWQISGSDSFDNSS